MWQKTNTAQQFEYHSHRKMWWLHDAVMMDIFSMYSKAD